VIAQATSVSVSASVKAFSYGVLMIRPSTDLSKSSKLRVLLGRTVDLSIELDCLLKVRVLDAMLLEKFVCRL
jgi:hypothetical protein